MLKPDVDQLIDEYETEKRNLEMELQECLQEFDYKRADYFSKALWRVKHKLRILQNIKNPFLERISHLEALKESHQSLMTKEMFTGMAPYFEDKIEKFEKEIRELKDRKITLKPQTQEFDDAVYDLIERKIPCFIFHLKKESNLYLDFRLTEKNILLISFTPLNNITNEYCVSDWNWKQIKLIGFEFNPESNSFQYSYNLAAFKNSIFLKELVSRIVFDALHIKDLDDPAYIEYK